MDTQKKLNWFEKNILGLKEPNFPQTKSIDDRYYDLKRSIYELMNTGISKIEEEELIKVLRNIEKIQKKAEDR